MIGPRPHASPGGESPRRGRRRRAGPHRQERVAVASRQAMRLAVGQHPFDLCRARGSRRRLEFVPDWFRKPARNVPNLRASDSPSCGAPTAKIRAVCRQKVGSVLLAWPLAMQKVEGSSPFSRLYRSPQIAGFFVALGARFGRTQELGIRIGHQNARSSDQADR